MGRIYEALETRVATQRYSLSVCPVDKSSPADCFKRPDRTPWLADKPCLLAGTHAAYPPDVPLPTHPGGRQILHDRAGRRADQTKITRTGSTEVTMVIRNAGIDRIGGLTYYR